MNYGQNSKGAGGKGFLANQRGVLAAVIATSVIIVVAAWLTMPATEAQVAQVVVYKTPYCGCCNEWVAHLRDNGFEVTAVNVVDTQPARERFGVPRRLGSCHTAELGNYWIEGHVPADLMKRLLQEQPDDIRGIAVPGMPIGSPGMEGPDPVAYQVLAYHADGEVTVFATRQGARAPQ